MNKFIDFISILQLGVGLNLVTGAYATQRRELEARIEKEIDHYREKMRRLLQEVKEKGPIEHDLHEKPVEALSIRELNRLLGDASIRFYRRSFQFKEKDKKVELALIPIAVFCTVALVLASLWPEENIAPYVSLPLSILILGTPIFAFLRTQREVKEHESYYRRATTENYSETIVGRHDSRMRSAPKDGELHAAFNELRRRASK